jgi:hypothetical protein
MRTRRLPHAKLSQTVTKCGKKQLKQVKNPGAARMAKRRAAMHQGQKDVEAAINRANRCLTNSYFKTPPAACCNFTPVSSLERWWWPVLKRCNYDAVVQLPRLQKGKPRDPFHGKIVGFACRRKASTVQYWVVVKSDKPLQRYPVVAAPPERVFADCKKAKEKKAGKLFATWNRSNIVDARMKAKKIPACQWLGSPEDQANFKEELTKLVCDETPRKR